MVDRLAEAGLVERRADPTDRRAWLLYLTPRADALLDGMRRTTDALAEEATEGLSDAERAQLIALVGRVRCNLSRRDAIPESEREKERSEEHTSELQSLMRISYAVFCLKKKNTRTTNKTANQ